MTQSSPENIFFSSTPALLRILYSSPSLKAAIWDYLQTNEIASLTTELGAAIERVRKKHGKNEHVKRVLDRVKPDEFQLYGNERKRQEVLDLFDVAGVDLETEHADLKKAIGELYPLGIRIFGGIVNNSETVMVRLPPREGKYEARILHYVLDDARRWILHGEYSPISEKEKPRF